MGPAHPQNMPDSQIEVTTRQDEGVTMRLAPSEVYKLFCLTLIVVFLFLIALDAGAFNI